MELPNVTATIIKYRSLKIIPSTNLLLRFVETLNYLICILKSLHPETQSETVIDY